MWVADMHGVDWRRGKTGRDGGGGCRGGGGGRALLVEVGEGVIDGGRRGGALWL